MNRRHLLALILLLALALRLPNIESIPKWDWDEGSFHNVAANLAQGRAQMFAVRYAWVPQPPGYFLLAAEAIRVAGDSIATTRLLSVSLGMLTIILLYHLGKEVQGTKAGLAAALIYAVYPKAIYWDRVALPYDLLVVFSTALLYFTVRYAKRGERGSLIATITLLNLTLLTGYYSIVFNAATYILVYWYRREDTVKVISLSLMLPALFLAYMAYSGSLGYFIDDLGGHTRIQSPAFWVLAAMVPITLAVIARSGRLRDRFLDSVYVGKGTPVLGIFLAYLPLLLLIPLVAPTDERMFYGLIDFLWVASVLGLACIDDVRDRAAIWSFYVSYLVVLLSFGRTDHMIIPLHPILALGAGMIISKMLDKRQEYSLRLGQIIGWKVPTILVAALIIAPAPALLVQDVDTFILKHGISEAPIAQAKRMAEIVNADTLDGDVVVTYSYLAPLTRGRATIVIQSLAYEGYRVSYQQPLPQDRFLYNASIAKAKYLIIPEGLADEFEKLGYGKAVEEMRGFDLVEEGPSIESDPAYQVYRKKR